MRKLFSFIPIILIIICMSFVGLAAQELEVIGDSPGIVAQVLPDIATNTEPTIDNGLVIYDLLIIFYAKAVKTVDQIKSNGMSLKGFISLLFLVILP